MTAISAALSLLVSLGTLTSPAALAGVPETIELAVADGASALPNDERLAPVRPALERQLARARTAGLPTDVVEELLHVANRRRMPP